MNNCVTKCTLLWRYEQLSDKIYFVVTAHFVSPRYCDEPAITATTIETKKCAAGYYCDYGSKSRQQANCGKGNYCTEGSDRKQPCPEGRYFVDCEVLLMRNAHLSNIVELLFLALARAIFQDAWIVKTVDFEYEIF